MFARAFLGQFERVFQDAINAGARHDGFLNDDFTVRAGIHLAADRGIFAFGVLAHDIEINITRFATGKGGWHAGHQFGRAQIDVLVKVTPEHDQRSPQRNMVRHRFRPADRTKEDRIVGFDLSAPVIWHHLAVLLIVVARSEFEFIKHQIEIKHFGGGLKHADAFGHDFGSDAVAGDDCDFMGGACHGAVLR